MWILKNSEEKILYLLPSKQYVIGRKDVDLDLDGDQSVSRKHAIITVGKRSRSSTLSGQSQASNPSVKLVDGSSKYGTFVKSECETNDWVRLQHGVEREVQSEDTIRFGLLQNKWRLVYEPLVVTMSGLKTEGKENLRNLIVSIDGQLTKSWRSDCTHLTMTCISLTVKTICALASGKPIVLPTYWSKYKENIAINEKPPDHEEFMPSVAEPSLNSETVSFRVNKKRSCIFKGKLFVFASQIDLQELGCMVTSAGATTAAFDEYCNLLDKLCQPHVVLVQCSFITSNSATTQEVRKVESFKKAEKLLMSRGRRTISEKEIGLAVLHCSTEKYCNTECHKVTETIMGNSNVRQAQSARTQLDFPSQALQSVSGNAHPPVQEKLDSVERNAPKIVPRSAKDTSVVNFMNASCDLFPSPIKTERISIEGSESPIPTDRQKRVRSFVPDDESVTKRHAPEREVFNRPSTSSCNPSSRNVSIKVESDEEDLFGFPMDKPMKKPEDNEEVDLFSFPNKSKATLSGFSKSKEENFLHPRDTLDCDLFETRPNSSLRSAQHITSSNKTKEVQNTACPESGIKKRKTPPDDEDVRPVKKAPPSLSTFGPSQQAPSETLRTTISLHGFLNASTLKNDIDNLADDVSLMVVIKRDNLVVKRDYTKLGFLNDDSSGVKNFKRFRKVLPVYQRILPRIIGGKDLYVYKPGADNKWNVSLDDCRVDNDVNDLKISEDDGWGFQNVKPVTKTRKAPAKEQ